MSLNSNLIDITVSQVGFKPAGGLRTAQDAIDYLALILNYLGPDWMNPHMLRFGASSLLVQIEKRLYNIAYNGMSAPPGILDYM